jgi:hypothetical protein
LYYETIKLPKKRGRQSITSIIFRRSLHDIRFIMTWPLGSSILSGDFSELLELSLWPPFPFQAVRLRFVDVEVKGVRAWPSELSWLASVRKLGDWPFISPSVYILFVVGRPRWSFVGKVCFAADGRASRYVDGIKLCLVMLNSKFQSWPMSTCQVSAGWWSILGSEDPSLFCVLQVSSFCKSPVLFCFTRESYCSAMYIVLLVFGAGDKHLFVLLSWERQVHL